jgi:hypothetical protein
MVEGRPSISDNDAEEYASTWGSACPTLRSIVYQDASTMGYMGFVKQGDTWERHD